MQSLLFTVITETSLLWCEPHTGCWLADIWFCCGFGSVRPFPVSFPQFLGAFLMVKNTGLTDVCSFHGVIHFWYLPLEHFKLFIVLELRAFSFLFLKECLSITMLNSQWSRIRDFLNAENQGPAHLVFFENDETRSDWLFLWCPGNQKRLA